MKIAARFALVLGVLIAGTLAMGAVALKGLEELRDSGRGLQTAVEEMELDSATRAELLDFQGKLALYASRSDVETRTQLGAEIEDLVAALRVRFAEIHRRYDSGRPVDLRLAEAQETPYEGLLALWRAGEAETEPGDDAGKRAVLASVDSLSAQIREAAEELARNDVEQAAAAQQQAERGHAGGTVRLVWTSMLAILLTALAAAGWLIRAVVPRTRRYAAFAGEVSRGRLSGRLDVRGRDELAELGQALNTMVARREAELAYTQRQAELSEVLQVATDEDEARQVLTRHLERAIPGGEVLILNRNNSADRLEAKTPLDPSSTLARALNGAGPRSCLALRFARPHRGGAGYPEALLGCEVCGAEDAATNCQPLLVGGEVIGSVLVKRDGELGPAAEAQLRDSLLLASPVLGNLRNLAIAQMRAATDALTGLPNNRAARDTIKRMAAQASRTIEPLTVALLDLDHFKQINDTFGHGRGDDVLAAVGAVLRETLRDSDFAARMGGEEFLLLLPATNSENAAVALEKVRRAISEITVSGVDRLITTSIGYALVPDHAGDADRVLRAADRALYVAKSQGRNQVLMATPSDAAARRQASESGP